MQILCQKHKTNFSLPEMRTTGGFTVVELLVVVAIIGILAGLLLPVLASVKKKAKGIACMNNMKQLDVGWLTYPDEHGDKLMQNSSGTSWVVKTYLTWGSDSINTNTRVLLDPKLSAMAMYIQSVGVYKCPGDTFQSPANPGPRVRSVSMNGTLNNKPLFINQNGRDYFMAKKTSDLIRPGPSEVFVFLDEHADSIDDGTFQVNPGYLPGQESWRNLPASYHNGAASFSFADGHAEIHRWLERSADNTTIYPVRMTGVPSSQPWNTPQRAFTSRDYEWLTDHMPYH